MPPFGSRGLISLAALLLTAPLCSSQQNSSNNVPRASHASSAQGSVAVTVTVVSSATVVINPDGTQKLIVANAPAAVQDVSRPQYVPMIPVKQMPELRNVEQNKATQDVAH